MNNLNEDTLKILRNMDTDEVQFCAKDICDRLRGKGFSPVQAEALLELAKKKLMECAVLD